MICLVAMALPATNTFADKIHLKSGEVVEGKVLEEDPDPLAGVVQSEFALKEGHVYIWDNGSMRQLSKADIVGVEKQIRPPEGVALLARPDQWGEEKYGYQTQLIATSKEFVCGKPMTFSVVMRNASNSLKMYDDQAIGHDSLMIKDSHGKEVYYKASSFQTLGGGQPIDTGEMTTLFQNRNITFEYVIPEPGTYTIQFREGNYGMSRDSTFPASNVLTFEARGEPSEDDVLIASLAEILPQGWRVAALESDTVGPAGRTPVKGLEATVYYHQHGKMGAPQAKLWQTEAAAGEGEGAGTGREKVSEYLGQSASGYFYYALIPAEAEELWPTIRADIKNALGLH